MAGEKVTNNAVIPGAGGGRGRMRGTMGGPGPGGGGPMKYEKPKNPAVTFKRLFSYLAGSKGKLLSVLLLVIISSGATIAGTAMLSPIVNEIGKIVSVGTRDFSGLIRYIAALICIYIAGVIAQYLYARIMLYVAQDTLHSLRKDLFDHLQDLPLRYFDSHAHGELMSRFTNDVDTIREVLTQGMMQALSSLISIAGTFVMMLIYSPVLTLWVVVMLFVMLFAVKTMGGRSAKYFREQQKAVGAVNGYIEEHIEGAKVIKVFCREKKTVKNFQSLNEDYRRAATSAHAYSNALMPVMGNLSYINYAVVAMFGAFLVINNGIGGYFALDVGRLAAYLQYTRQFAQPITMMAQQFNNVLAALAGAERIFEVIDQKAETDDGYVTLINAKYDDKGNLTETGERTGLWAWKHPHSADGSLTYTPLAGDVRFHDVTFSYDDNNDVLKNVSLYAKPGQKLALVGSTGAGKTTITNLINRFYDVDRGKITFDGINVKKIKKDDLRRSLAMVLQDTHLFTGTVEENIRYGRLDATREEVVRAAKLANAHSFISRLPEGYDTVLKGDGISLSQGQRQLLAIARAAVADPPVLILDEATSSVDTRTERLIELGMDKLMEGRTVFVIAHRLSTVRNADCIMVLENGGIIEKGNHDELMEQKGKYYSLYAGQFSLE